MQLVLSLQCLPAVVFVFVVFVSALTTVVVIVKITIIRLILTSNDVPE